MQTAEESYNAVLTTVLQCGVLEPNETFVPDAPFICHLIQRNAQRAYAAEAFAADVANQLYRAQQVLRCFQKWSDCQTEMEDDAYCDEWIDAAWTALHRYTEQAAAQAAPTGERGGGET